MITKESSNGIGSAIVRAGDVRHVFASAVPRNGGDLGEQGQDALSSIRAVFEKHSAGSSIIKQCVFTKGPELTEECRQIVKDFYGDDLPATTYVPQPPCSGKLLEIEAIGIGREGAEVEIERHSEQLVVSRHDGVAWFHTSHVCPKIRAPHLYDRSIDAFKQLRNGLESKRVRFEQVVRTWLYLGDIVGPEGETQRYKELNRARSDFYQDIEFAAEHLPPEIDWRVYPASTGIGTDGQGVVMSSIALATDREDVVLVPLENPQQTSAFDYREHYSPRSPKFSRAMAITVGKFATIFISGTASITGSETRFVGNAEGQTRQTFDNIEALISRDNFACHGVADMGATLDDMALVRVYVKHQEDYAKVKAICKERLGGLPAVYTLADICRPDLLVEIEGIAFSLP